MSVVFGRDVIQAVILFIALCVCAELVYAESLFPPTAEELEALHQLEQGKYKSARKQAEALLEKNPDSFWGMYVMAGVFEEGEGNLTRAQYLKQSLRRKFESIYVKDGEVPYAGEVQNWHRRLLMEEADLFAQLDKREEQLESIARYEHWYGSGLDRKKIWALMKLRRFDEAKALANRLKHSTEEDVRQVAYNGLLSIADTEFAYDESESLSEEAARETGYRSCVIMGNWGKALMNMMRVNEAEEKLRAALLAEEQDCSGSPNNWLIGVYLAQGKYQLSIGAAKALRQEKLQGRMKVQKEKSNRGAIAELLYAMGYTEQAYELMRTVINAPDRQGYNSFSEEKVQFGYLVMYVDIMKSLMRRYDEIIVSWGGGGLWGFGKGVFVGSKGERLYDAIKEKIFLEGLIWDSIQKIRKYALDPMNYRGVFVPFNILSPVYYVSLVEILGEGISRSLLNYERRMLNSKEVETLKPIFDYIEGVIAWRGGRSDEALEKFGLAKQSLPKSMQQLEDFISVIIADILWSKGDFERSNQYFHEVMTRYPASLRNLGIRLPVVYRSDDDLLSRRALERIRESDSFLEHESALLMIDIHKASGEGLSICMSNRQGYRYSCMDGSDKRLQGVSEDEVLALSLELFHLKAFNPGVDVSQEDINSLDGRAVRVSADEALKDLM